MSDVIVLGTDTNAGKTTFALLWLALFSEEYCYWKPVETGDSDTGCVGRLIPQAKIHAPLARFIEPVAPPLAAQREGKRTPTSAEIIKAKPIGLLLIETFGSPFSPLTETELQISYLQSLPGRRVLVSSSLLGAIGRTLQTIDALSAHGIGVDVVVLMGPEDPFAEGQIRIHFPTGRVISLQPPQEWTTVGVLTAAREQESKIRLVAKPTTRDREESRGRDPHRIWHPYTSLRDPDPPLEVVGMEGSFLYLADGRQLVDGISSWWTIQHGHRHPPLMMALRNAMLQYDHVIFAGVTHPPAEELAELLLQTMPWSGGRVFYSDNGSTAVEVALKMAYQYWCHRQEAQRTTFVSFEHGYHGDTFGAMAVSRDPLFFGRFEPLLFRAEQIPLDAQQLDELLHRKSSEVAAVILEPLVQGAGGMRMHTPQELRAIFEVTRRHGIVLIADEVMTGGGRTGTRWAYESAQIAPDLICAAKTLAGGILPLAVTLAAPHIVSAFDTDDRTRTFFHGHSFTANPLACAVAVANQKLMTAGDWRQQVETINAYWQRYVKPLQELPRVQEVRICGSIAAIEVNSAGGYLAEVGRTMRRASLEHGVLLRPLGNVLYAMPPFATAEKTLEQIVTAMRRALAAAW